MSYRYAKEASNCVVILLTNTKCEGISQQNKLTCWCIPSRILVAKAEAIRRKLQRPVPFVTNKKF